MKINSAAGKFFELCGAPNVSKTVLKTGFLYKNALLIQKKIACGGLYGPNIHIHPIYT